eukprot:3499977-Pleurochrysis_carterae.AAC.1
MSAAYRLASARESAEHHGRLPSSCALLPRDAQRVVGADGVCAPRTAAAPPTHGHRHRPVPRLRVLDVYYVYYRPRVPPARLGRITPLHRFPGQVTRRVEGALVRVTQLARPQKEVVRQERCRPVHPALLRVTSRPRRCRCSEVHRPECAAELPYPRRGVPAGACA